jgi:glucose 1-dehydrogenase
MPRCRHADGALLVRGMAVGICGTDREIAEGAYGEPPSGEARLVIGHESLGEVLATGHRGTSAWTPESQLGGARGYVGAGADR